MLAAGVSGDASTIQAFIPLLTGAGGALVVLAIGLYLFISNRIHSDAEFKRTTKIYQDGLADEREAHAKTREALAIANARADAGLRSSEIIAAVLQSQKKGSDA